MSKKTGTNQQNKKTTIIAIISIMALVIVIINNPGENITQDNPCGDAIIHQGTGDINTGGTNR